MGKQKKCLLANGLIIRVATVHIICDLFLVALTCKLSAFSGFQVVLQKHCFDLLRITAFFIHNPPFSQVTHQQFYG